MMPNDTPKDSLKDTLKTPLTPFPKAHSRQIIFDTIQPIDSDFIRDCIQSKQFSKSKNRIESNLSLNGSSKERDINGFSDEELDATHSSPTHCNRIEQAKQMMQEAAAHIDAKEFDAAIQFYCCSCYYLIDLASHADYLPLLTRSKLGLASLYIIKNMLIDAEKELKEIMLINPNCEQAKELLSKILSNK